MKDDWFVRLGQAEWMRFTYQRSEDDPVKPIGSVRCGPQVGALGVMEGERYVQINGDFSRSLNTYQIRKAIARAKAKESRDANHPSGFQPRIVANKPQAPAPVIVIKRRRVWTADSDTPQAAALKQNTG